MGCKGAGYLQQHRRKPVLPGIIAALQTLQVLTWPAIS